MPSIARVGDGGRPWRDGVHPEGIERRSGEKAILRRASCSVAFSEKGPFGDPGLWLATLEGP